MLTDASDISGEFGSFKLVRRLGVGGMAETFVAVRRKPGGFSQRVCLKLVLPFFRDNQEFIDLFHREAQLAAKLRHRNIVGIIDFGEVLGTPYMALELVDGLDLAKVLYAQPGSKLSHEVVAMIGLELAEALEHAHSRSPDTGTTAAEGAASGIVHRDISPCNVLISRQGEVLLSDFGLAKAIAGTSRKQSSVKGKTPYMSPEQLLAEPLDGRADLFALGVVLFEALAGRRPYEGEQDAATLKKILDGQHPSLADLAPETPAGMRALIERLIKPDKSQRPDTAASLIEELAEFAPSPRVRRRFGRMVAQLSNQRKATRNKPTNKATQLLDTPLATTGVLKGEESRRNPQDSERWAKALPSPQRSPDMPATAPIPQRHVPLEKLSADPTKQTQIGLGPVALEAIQSSTAVSQASSVDISTNEIAMPAREGGTGAPMEIGSNGVWDDLPKPPIHRRWPVAVIALFIVGGWYAVRPDPDPPDTEVASTGQSTRRAGATDRHTNQAQPSVNEKSDPALASNDLRNGTADNYTPYIATISDGSGDGPKPTAGHTITNNTLKKSKQAKQPDPKTAKSPGRLTVTVFPWGNIWINGKPWGRAPLKRETLKAGRYKVSVGQNGPAKTRTIRLRPGQRRTVHFDLTK